MAILHLQEPYRLIPETAPSKPLAIRGPDGADVYSNDFLPGRPAGPTRPDEPILAPEKDPNEVPLSEAERNKLRALAKEFGFGGETLVNQYQVRIKKRSLRRFSCSLAPGGKEDRGISETLLRSNQRQHQWKNAPGKCTVLLLWSLCSLQAYFSEFGEVRSVSVIRDKDTGLSKGFGFVSMQASDGAKKALLKQVIWKLAA